MTALAFLSLALLALCLAEHIRAGHAEQKAERSRRRAGLVLRRAARNRRLMRDAIHQAMDAEADREEAIRVLVEQQEAITELEREVEASRRERAREMVH